LKRRDRNELRSVRCFFFVILFTRDDILKACITNAEVFLCIITSAVLSRAFHVHTFLARKTIALIWSAKISQVRFQISASLFNFVLTCECYSFGESLNLHSIVPAAHNNCCILLLVLRCGIPAGASLAFRTSLFILCEL
jgi:hypothetical protein